MTNRCKPGDVAMIIQNIDHNLGKMVVVERPYGMKEYDTYGSLFCWYILSLGGKLKTSDGELVWYGHIPDMALRPIGDGQLDVAAIRRAHADSDFAEALQELAQVFREIEEDAPTVHQR